MTAAPVAAAPPVLVAVAGFADVVPLVVEFDVDVEFEEPSEATAAQMAMEADAVSVMGERVSKSVSPRLGRV
jgi:hypothetical protein